MIVRRYGGNLDTPISVAYTTKDGTAKAGIDYKEVQVGARVALQVAPTCWRALMSGTAVQEGARWRVRVDASAA